MAGRRKSRTSFPAAGDFVLIGYRWFDEPRLWWITKVLWSDGAEHFLTIQPAAEADPAYPDIRSSDAFITFGAEDHCRAVHAAAFAARRALDEPFRKASLALTAAKHAIHGAIVAAVDCAGARRPGTLDL